MVLGRIIGRILPKASVAVDTVATRGVSKLATADSAVVARSSTKVSTPKVKDTLDYSRKVFALPEGQVTTRSGKVYTRTMGSDGQRIYTDANGNQTFFNGLYYQRPWLNESAIYRTTPEGGYYSLRFSTSKSRFDRGKQEVTRWIRERVGGNCHTTTIEINPQGRVEQTRFETFIGTTGKSSGIETRYGCPTPWNHQDVYGWLNSRGVTEAPPLWTSLSQYTR